MIRNMETCDWQVSRINEAGLQQIAVYLQSLITNHEIGEWFTARDLVGRNQIEWANTPPLNLITIHYSSQSTQKTVLGKILKKTIFDLPIIYELNMDFVAHYRRLE